MKGYELGILVGVCTLFLVVFFQLVLPAFSSPSGNDIYWNQVTLTSYIIDKYTDLDKISHGNGHVSYMIGDKEYGIVCKQRIYSDSVARCCKEGEVDFDVRYDWDTIKWINVTYEDDCY